MMLDFGGVQPEIGEDAFIAESAMVIGDVKLGARVSVWFGAVLRGDVGKIEIGQETNIQDLSVVHVTSGEADTHIGSGVTVGHRAVLHGCRVCDRVLVGMGAIVLDQAEIGEGSIVGAGALVTPRTRIPPGSLVLGSPARVVRRVSDEELAHIDSSARHYVELAARYRGR